MGQSTRLAGHSSAGRAVAEMARHVWTRYWTRRAEHATVGILYGLDDRTLKDIGLDRSEIESVAHDARRAERRIA
jgi:uncharacterized protein YjiS (DUF1127 family)